MHGKLLLQVSYLLLASLYHKMLVELDVDYSFIRNSHHSGSEFQSANSLLQVASLRPDVSDHDCFAIATETITEKVSQARLPVGDVITHIRT